SIRDTDFRGANLLFAKAGEDDYVPRVQQCRGRFSVNLDSNERLRIPSPGSPRDDLIDVTCNLFCERQRPRTRLLLITVVDRSGDTNQSGIGAVQAHRVIHQIKLTPVFAGHYAAVRLVPI